MEPLIRNIRYRIRRLLEGPAFPVVSTLSLAVAIGACAVVFSIANALLLRQLPYPKPERLVEVKQINSNGRRTSLCDVHYDPEPESAYE